MSARTNDARAAPIRDGLLAAARVAAGDDHVRALRREPQRDRAAGPDDRRAGDDRDRAVDLHGRRRYAMAPTVACGVPACSSGPATPSPLSTPGAPGMHSGQIGSRSIAWRIICRAITSFWISFEPS